MADTDYLINSLQEQLGKMRNNEEIYKYKLQLLNQGRSKITDEIDQLSFDYEKKMKQMQLKVKRLSSENQALLKQNEIYKQEIQNFQSRLMEKEKLINMMVSQQSQHLLNLDTSAHSQKFDESQYIEKRSHRSAKNKSDIHESQKQAEKVTTNPFQKKKIPPPIKKYVGQSEQQNIQQPNEYQNYQHKLKMHQSQKPSLLPNQKVGQYRTVIPPPPHKSKHSKPVRHPNNHRKIPKYQAEADAEQHYTTETNKFQNNHAEQNNHSTVQIVQNSQQKEENIDDKQKNYEEQKNEYDKEKIVQQENLRYVNYQNEQTQQQHYEQNVVQIHQYYQVLEQEQEQGHDFLKHFQKDHKQQQQQSAANFFNNMSQNTNPTYDINIESDLQQSSIDYQDNSIMSSNANVFAQSNELVQPPKKSMPKKKAKRDKIKIADPTMFE